VTKLEKILSEKDGKFAFENSTYAEEHSKNGVGTGDWKIYLPLTSYSVTDLHFLKDWLDEWLEEVK
jgi:hypothetical protein